MAAPPMEYPVQLGLAYLFLVGYLVRSVFISLKLPGAVGVILSGFAFSYFMQADILDARDSLQQLAFFLVLLTAGFEISLRDLRPHILVFALLPASLELVALACYGVLVYGYTWVESFVLGTALFCIGDGLVIPKMHELGKQFPGHTLPRLVFMWAPLEASFALTVFGILVGLSEPAHQPSVDIGLLVLANVFRIVATITAGGLLGAATGWLVTRRTQFVSVSREPIFSGGSAEAFLMIFAVALAAFGFGAGAGGRPFIPIGFSSGPLFQPELLVIVTGTFFAAVAEPQILHSVMVTMGGIWVFGQLILFGMLGSRTEPGVFVIFLEVLPLMLVGLSVRFVGVLLAVLLTQPMRPCCCAACRQANWACIWPETVFCFVSTLPRATIQGALGAVPSTERFFQGDPLRRHVQVFITSSSRLYIICCSIVGSILLDLVGPWALRAAERERQRFTCTEGVIEREKEIATEGWTCHERQMKGFKTVPGEEVALPGSVEEAVRILADAYAADPHEVLRDARVEERLFVELASNLEWKGGLKWRSLLGPLKNVPGALGKLLVRPRFDTAGSLLSTGSFRPAGAASKPGAPAECLLEA